MNNVLMKCGHMATATTKENKPFCIICVPKKESFEIEEVNPSLEGRKAMCSYCDKIADSSFDLPFFEYRPNEEFDLFYDGCLGWS